MPLHTQDEARVTAIRAPLARMIRTMLLEAAGAEAWAQVLEDLDAETRGLGAPGAELPEWVPVGPVSAWADAFRHRIGPSPIGQSLVDQLVEDAHPWMQRSLDPAFGAESISRIFRHYHRGGMLHLESLEAGRAAFDLWAFLPYPGWHDQLLPAAFGRTVARCGGHGVAVSILPPAPDDPPYRHHYEVRWR